MASPPPLIRHIDRLARERGWSQTDLAHTLGIDATALMHVRAGRRGIGTKLLSAIARQFFQDDSVRDLIWGFLLVEVPEGRREAPRGTAAPFPGAEEEARKLSEGTQKDLFAYVSNFRDEYLERRGLLLVSSDDAALATALRLLERELERRSIRTFSISAHAKPSASEARTALAVPLLVVPRVEFASAETMTVLARRFELLQPTAVSTVRPVADLDDFLRRIVTAMSRTIKVEAASLNERVRPSERGAARRVSLPPPANA